MIRIVKIKRIWRDKGRVILMLIVVGRWKGKKEERINNQERVIKKYNDSST